MKAYFNPPPKPRIQHGSINELCLILNNMRSNSRSLREEQVSLL